MDQARNTNSQPLDRLIPIPEVIERLGIGRTSVYAALRDGTLPSIKLGRRRLVPASAFRTYLQSLGVNPAP
jgi:excisionase family DNA binding protein